MWSIAFFITAAAMQVVHAQTPVGFDNEANAACIVATVSVTETVFSTVTVMSSPLFEATESPTGLVNTATHSAYQVSPASAISAPSASTMQSETLADSPFHFTVESGTTSWLNGYTPSSGGLMATGTITITVVPLPAPLQTEMPPFENTQSPSSIMSVESNAPAGYMTAPEKTTYIHLTRTTTTFSTTTVTPSNQHLLSTDSSGEQPTTTITSTNYVTYSLVYASSTRGLNTHGEPPTSTTTVDITASQFTTISTTISRQSPQSFATVDTETTSLNSPARIGPIDTASVSPLSAYSGGTTIPQSTQSDMDSLAPITSSLESLELPSLTAMIPGSLLSSILYSAPVPTSVGVQPFESSIHPYPASSPDCSDAHMCAKPASSSISAQNMTASTHQSSDSAVNTSLGSQMPAAQQLSSYLRTSNVVVMTLNGSSSSPESTVTQVSHSHLPGGYDTASSVAATPSPTASIDSTTAPVLGPIATTVGSIPDGYGRAKPSENQTTAGGNVVAKRSSIASPRTGMPNITGVYSLPKASDVSASWSGASRSVAATISTRIPPSYNTRPSPTQSTGSAATSLSGPSSSEACGELGDFILGFDDLPSFHPTQDSDITQQPPVFSPYHHLSFSDGYVYAPEPTEPYAPVSSPNVAVFLPSSAGFRASGGMLPGEIGDGSRESLSAYWFNANSAYLGCDNIRPANCTVVFTAFTWDANSKDEVASFHKNATLTPCTSSENCQLQKVELPTSFRSLTGLQIQAFVDGQATMFFVDDIALSWTNNTCAAGLQRASGR